MIHWKNPTINLGVIKAGPSKKAVFKGLDTMPEIKVITPYCGCTATEFNKQTKELHITYSNSSIPDQVQGPQSISKRIDVLYVDGTTDILTINATKIR
jgi:hypothetical protein